MKKRLRKQNPEGPLPAVEPTEPEFWEQRYRADRIPWDMRGVPAALLQYLQHHPLPGRVLIPGCGSGYEVRTFVDAHWDTLAIDFAPAAIERAKTVVGPRAADTLRLADFFRDELNGGPFDAIYERTFLCSLPPERWSDYVKRSAELLAPHGRLFGIFVYGQESEPPPYPLTWRGATELFGRHFALVEDCGIAAEASLPLFAGQERWQVWQRK